MIAVDAGHGVDDRGRVAVIGAGLAGLTAAWRLHQAGCDVVVLEARDRVGGRTWSMRLENDVVVERGGEFIAPAHDCLRGLCDELGLALVPHGFSFDARASPGVPAPTADEIHALIAQAQARLSRDDLDRPIASVLPASGEQTRTQASIIRRLQTSLTVPLGEASGRRVLVDESEGYDPAVRVRGGNDSVARELARRLGERVRLGSAVLGLDHDADGVSVGLDAGPPVRADAAVVAVPLPLLLELDLGLPPALLAAAHRLHFGDAAKLHLPVTLPATVGGIASPDAPWWCWVSRSPNGDHGAGALSGFAGGADAIHDLGADRTARRWADAALRLRPDLTATGDPRVTHWGAERWSRGSYSVAAVGADADDDRQWTRAWGRLAFAGEHTAGPDAGTMNGAALSGARAARTVVAALSSSG